jgi:hypothetical protein
MRLFLLCVMAGMTFMSGCQKTEKAAVENAADGGAVANIVPPALAPPPLIAQVPPIGPAILSNEERPDNDHDLDPCSNLDPDSDGDGVCDSVDRCPGSDDGIDKDRDGSPFPCDCDDENPGVIPGFPCRDFGLFPACKFEICDPDLSGACLLTNKAEGVVCGTTLYGDCDAPDLCDGAGTCIDRFRGNEIICRENVGVCNTAERCSGVSASCPADSFAAAGVPCGVNNQGQCIGDGNCDMVNACPLSPPGDVDSDGDNWLDACDCAPNDPTQFPGQPCESDGLPCTVDICDPNATPVCLHFALQVGRVCGAGPTDTCDRQDTCNEQSLCVDNVATDGVICRNTEHACDEFEQCDGINKACPINQLSPVGKVCGPAPTGNCDLLDRCDVLGNCINELKDLGAICRPKKGECDFEETCSGVSPDCPVDITEPNGTVCGFAPSGDCDLQNTCQSGLCADIVEPLNTVCRPSISTEQCDPSEVCNGVSPSCPSNTISPDGNTGDACLAGSGLNLTIEASCLGDSGTFLCVDGGTICYPNDEAQCYEQSISRDDVGAGISSAFGWAVSIDGAFSVAGAPTDITEQGFNSGSIFKIERNGLNQWVAGPQIELPTDDSGNSTIKDILPSATTFFGGAVSNIGALSLAGAKNLSYNTNGFGKAKDAGAVLVHLSNVFLETIISPTAQDKASFGADVDFDGSWAVIGDPGFTSEGGFFEDSNGAAEFYQFLPLVQQFSFVHQVIPSDNQTDDHFGNAVSLDGEWAIIGAYKDDFSTGDENDQGSAYFYKYNPSTNRWVQQQKIVSPPSYADQDNNFGYDVAIRGNLAIVGEPNDDFSGFDNLGRAHIYRLNGSTWDYEATLTPSLNDNDLGFGTSVDIQGNVAVVGAPGAPETDVFDTLNDRVYIFVNDGDWTPYGSPLAGSDLGASNDAFGNSVAINGDWIVIGAPFSFTGSSVFYYFFPYEAISNPI